MTRDSPGVDFALGAQVRGRDGVVGTIEGIAVTPGTLRASWLVILMPGGLTTAIPTAAASVDARAEVVTPFDRQSLLSAPGVLDGVVSAELADRLLAHYGLDL